MRDEHEPADSIDLEESHGLLDDDVDAKDGHAYVRKTQWRLWLWRFSKFAGVAFVALAIACAFILVKKVPGSSFSSDDGVSDLESRGQLAIPLHPSRHSTRKPTTLEFHWNITTKLASPDGVEKKVYLVNGMSAL